MNDQAISALRIDPTHAYHGGGERPIDRFARLLADIRRTHPMTASLIVMEYGTEQWKDAWLDEYLPQLEHEWADGDARAPMTTESEGE